MPTAYIGVMRTIASFVTGAAALATAMAVNIQPSQAGTIGNAPWCAVQNNGGGDIIWDCEFQSAEQCAPMVTAGNRGFCNLNPSWPAYAPAPPPPHRKHRRS
jgi:hypothetical protein